MVIGFRTHTDKLEFVGRADSQVVTNVVCNRFHPDPLGIVLWRYKSEFVGPSEHVIPNQCAHWCGNLHRIPCGLSSYRLSFLYRFPEFIHEKLYFLSNQEIATPVTSVTGSQ